MRNELTDSLFSTTTAVLIGFLSVAIYVLVIRPLTLPREHGARGVGTAGGTSAATAAAASGATAGTTSAAAASAATAQPEPKIRCARVPPHVSDASAALAVNGGSNLLVDGLVAFRHCRAASAAALPGTETSTGGGTPSAAAAGGGTDETATAATSTTKARAKLLSNLLADSGVTSPPIKGSTVVVAIAMDGALDCRQQRLAVHLLATYYNLLVVLTVSDNDDDDAGKAAASSFTDADRKSAVAKLRGATLTTSILPAHRILVSSTVAGRVALVRQLQRVELVVDYDPSVRTLLARFGHRVVVYGGGGGETTGRSDTMVTSQLGRAML